MYLMYVDESGDTGIRNSPSRYFCISAIVIHESSWKNVLDDLILFRQQLKDKFGIRMREEIHASEMMNGRAYLAAKPHRHQKLLILKLCLDWLNSRNDISVFSVRYDKSRPGTGPDYIFDYTWEVLIQRFENTLNHGNFPNSTGSDKGMLICDNTDGDKLRKKLRKMRKYNTVPNKYFGGWRNLTLVSVIEDPVMRDSATSYFHQMVDVVAYFSRQLYEPNSYIKKKGARKYYVSQLQNVINQYVVTQKSDHKIVEI